MATDWSNLPGPALVLILDRLIHSSSASAAVADYIRFRSICTSWRAINAPSRSQLPWLIARGEPPSSRYTFTFFNLSAALALSPTADNHEILLADKQPNLPHHNFSFYGSSHGWMIFYLCYWEDSRIFFYNPLTNSRIDFPPLNTSSIYRFRKIFVSDPALSKVLVFLSYTSRKITIEYCEFGEKREAAAWTVIRRSKLRKENSYNYLNATYYKGQFYIVSRLKMYVLDTAGAKPRLVKIPVDRSDMHRWSISGIRGWRATVDIPIPRSEKSRFPETNGSYLVESCSGDLLLVLCICPSFENYSYIFDIYKVEFTGRRAKLRELTSLGDSALFLGFSEAFSLSSAQTGCVGNHIYFMSEIGQFVTVYNVANGRNRHIIYEGWNVSSWIAPNPYRDILMELDRSMFV